MQEPNKIKPNEGTLDYIKTDLESIPEKFKNKRVEEVKEMIAKDERFRDHNIDRVF